MCDELRKLMAQADNTFRGRPLSGHVEIDETLVGGRYSRKRGKPSENKTVVLAMVERGGRMVAGPVPDVTTYTLEGIINENVAEGTTISTDENRAYSGLKHGYQHGTVNHTEKEYVRGIHHVNTLESHWSHFKRAVKGTHVHISTKHAWKYVAEFTYRRNKRHSHWSMFNPLVHAFALPRLQDA